MDQKKPTTSVKEEPKLERKPSIREKQGPPIVRQTLTSSRRIFKALNPLGKFLASKPNSASTCTQSTGTVLKQTQGSSASTESKQFTGTTALRRTQSVKETRPKYSIQPQSSFNFKRPQSTQIQSKPSTGLKQNQAPTEPKQLTGSTALRRTQSVKETRPKYSQPQSSFNFKRPQSIQIHKKTGTDLNKKSNVHQSMKNTPKPGTECRRPQWRPSLPKQKPELKQKRKVDEILKDPPPMNRKKSLSADHIQTKTNKPIITECQSIENLCMQTPEELNGLSPIRKEEADKSLLFKTPSAYRRRSIYHHVTPSSNRKFSNFLIASTPAPDQMLRLQDRLNKWLRSRGKPPAEFHNLNKIVESNKNLPNMVINEIEEQNKENIEVVDCKSESYEDLKINIMPEEDITTIAKEATVDLMRLVEQGYPTSECLELLDLIKQKHGKIVDAPEYWELRACIDEAEGNIADAVEHFSTAIIQGAKITSVNKSLDLLLQKFSSLNISPSKLIHKTQEEIDQRVNARDVFKTRIILFSIRERDAKKNQGTESPHKKFIATPVRRSSRLSTSMYKNSPGLTLCRSLKQADNAADISFAKNKALV